MTSQSLGDISTSWGHFSVLVTSQIFWGHLNPLGTPQHPDFPPAPLLALGGISASWWHPGILSPAVGQSRPTGGLMGPTGPPQPRPLCPLCPQATSLMSCSAASSTPSATRNAPSSTPKASPSTCCAPASARGAPTPARWVRHLWGAYGALMGWPWGAGSSTDPHRAVVVTIRHRVSQRGPPTLWVCGGVCPSPRAP